jgi:hypothetical protein
VEEQLKGVYLVRIDSEGSLLWQRTYNALEGYRGHSIDETSDGGFIIAGTACPSGPSRRDIYLIKTDDNGDLIWTRTYGGSKFNSANSVQQTADGNYIVAGASSAFGAGGNDVFVIQVDGEGKALWARAFGGAGDDIAYQVQQTMDGGFIIAGSTKSYGRGYSDIYLLRVAPTPVDPVEPDLAIGVLQNPYMTQYLDVYLVASEALDSASVELVVDGDSVGIGLLDADTHLWRADYRAEPPGGVISIMAAASDLAGNDTTTAASFSVGSLSAGGGVISSPDGRVRLRVGHRSLGGDIYAVILPRRGSEGRPDLPGQVLPRGLHVLSSCGAPPAGYYVGPAAAMEGGACIEFSYRASDLPPGAGADRLYIRDASGGALESYIDERRQVVCATIFSPGTFSLVLGSPGASRRRDDVLLDIAGSFPNPFSEAVTVRFEIASRQRIKVTVYDVLGREVARLLDEVVYPGSHEVRWRGRSQRGDLISSGHYFVRIESEHASGTSKVNLIR